MFFSSHWYFYKHILQVYNHGYGEFPSSRIAVNHCSTTCNLEVRWTLSFVLTFVIFRNQHLNLTGRGTVIYLKFSTSSTFNTRYSLTHSLDVGLWCKEVLLSIQLL